MMRFVSLSAGLLLTCVLVGGVGAQDTLYTLQSPNPADGGWFGWNCEGIGDVNNDTCEDIGVAATYESPGGVLRAGMAYVFSGQTGALLYELSSPNPQINGEFGWIAGLGDVNGDGNGDFVVTEWRAFVNGLNAAGRAYVYSGATGDTLYSVVSPTPEFDGRFGAEAAAAGDVDGDGYPDFAVGARGEDYAGVPNAGRVHVFSGATGALIWTLGSSNPTTGGRFGEVVANAGDVDADGTDDLVVGAGYEDPGGIGNAGMAYVFSGATGNLLYPLSPPDVQAGAYFGWGLWGGEDLNGDGYADVVVGAAWLDIGETNVGRAYIFSGATGDTLHTLDSPHPAEGGHFGNWVWGGEDYDNDGCADMVLGAPGEAPGGIEGAGRAYVFSGDTGQLMVELSSPMPEVGGQFGIWVGGADANGDGKIEVIIAADTEDAGAVDAGRVYVFHGTSVPIELASFRGQAEEAGVRLVWVTLTEQDNLGFNVERAPDEHARYARLNDHLIPGAGTTSVPHTYSYLDEAVEQGCTYWYRLEDVSLTGERALHGPIQVVFPGSPALALNVLGSSEPVFALSLPGPGRAVLDLYNVSGRLVARLWEGQAEAGVTVIRPEGCRTLPDGVYTAILSQHGMTAQRRVVIAQ
jgi:hypothetical protein